MKVDLIAHTVIQPEAMSRNGFDCEPGVSDLDTLAEFAGRSCYQSFDRPNPATAKNRGYLAHINEVGHFSLYRHASVSFYITGVSRSLTHELVVHKHLAHSQLSQRYVDEEHGETVVPPAYRDEPELAGLVEVAHRHMKAVYTKLVGDGEHLGLKRKEARQAARAVLPNATETRIVVTGNVQAWRQFIAVRHSVHADDEIRELAGLILEQLRQVAGNSVQDVPSEPYSTPTPALTAAELEAALVAQGVDAVRIDGVLDQLFPKAG